MRKCTQKKDDDEIRRLTLSIENDIRNVSLVGVSVGAICKTLSGMKKSVAWQLELAVVEAVNNAVMHAHVDYGSEKNRIEVVVEIDKNAVTFAVYDWGSPRGFLSQPPDLHEFDPSDPMTVPECGRGLFIIHGIMDAVRLTRRDNRNILTMTKYL